MKKNFYIYGNYGMYKVTYVVENNTFIVLDVILGRKSIADEVAADDWNVDYEFLSFEQMYNYFKKFISVYESCF